MKVEHKPNRLILDCTIKEAFDIEYGLSVIRKRIDNPLKRYHLKKMQNQIFDWVWELVK